MPRKLGALPDHMIRELIRNGSIEGAKHAHVGPASLDLSVSGEAYRIQNLFLPYPRERIRDLLAETDPLKHDLRLPMERGVTYLVRLNERLQLPRSIYGFCNPKSSAGRIDVHVRVLADGVARYDAAAPGGFSGELWIAITPNSFPIIIPKGEQLNQLRLFNHDTRLDETELQIALKTDPLLWVGDKRLAYDDLRVSDNDGSVLLTIDLKREKGPAGYECRGVTRLLDFSQRKFYRSEDFFKEVRPHNGKCSMEEGKFYVFNTRERLQIPPGFAAEVVPMDDRSGEFRSHFAGFIDPGFDGTLVLEIRPYQNIVFRHGQPVCKIRFERLIELPDAAYGANANYQNQSGPALSKHFIPELQIAA